MGKHGGLSVCIRNLTSISPQDQVLGIYKHAGISWACAADKTLKSKNLITSHTTDQLKDRTRSTITYRETPTLMTILCSSFLPIAALLVNIIVQVEVRSTSYKDTYPCGGTNPSTWEHLGKDTRKQNEMCGTYLLKNVLYYVFAPSPYAYTYTQQTVEEHVIFSLYYCLCWSGQYTNVPFPYASRTTSHLITT